VSFNALNLNTIGGIRNCTQELVAGAEAEVEAADAAIETVAAAGEQDRCFGTVEALEWFG